MVALRLILRGAREFQRSIGDIRKLTAGPDRSKILRIAGMEYVKDARANITEQHGPNGARWKGGPPKSRPGGKRLQDTRRLYNAISYRIGTRNVTLEVPVEYAALQHFGGTIRPKRKKKLFQPLSRSVALRYHGNARRDFPGAFVIKSRKGNLLLVRKQDGGARGRRRSGLELLGLLRDSSRIPASPFMGESARAWMAIRRRVEPMFRNAWDQRAGGGSWA